MSHQLTASCYDRKGTLISRAHNSYDKTHPLQAHFANLVGKPASVFLHAEIAALLGCRDRVPHSIHVERYKKDGKPGLAKPCPICMSAIRAYGVKHITFTEG